MSTKPTSAPRPPTHAMTPAQTRDWVTGIGEWAKRLEGEAHALGEQTDRLLERMDPDAPSRPR